MLTTLEQLRDAINESEEWSEDLNSTIESNGWTDETGEKYGICNDGKRRLEFNSDMIAEIVELES